MNKFDPINKHIDWSNVEHVAYLIHAVITDSITICPTPEVYSAKQAGKEILANKIQELTKERLSHDPPGTELDALSIAYVKKTSARWFTICCLTSHAQAVATKVAHDAAEQTAGRCATARAGQDLSNIAFGEAQDAVRYYFAPPELKEELRPTDPNKAADVHLAKSAAYEPSTASAVAGADGSDIGTLAMQAAKRVLFPEGGE